MDKTIFRVYPGGEVIALFPQISASLNGGLCASYMHIGQHDGANPEFVISRTRLATPEEYESLLRELEQIGYNPKPAKRCTYQDFLLRQKQYQIAGG